MSHQKLTADAILLPNGDWLESGTLVLDSKGCVLELAGNIQEGARHFNGFLVPGMINAHCHLELSYLKGAIASGDGLSAFIHEMITKRKPFDHDQMHSAHAANREMWESGIQGVGDIANGVEYFKLKSEGSIRYHNLFEVFGMDASKVDVRMQCANEALSSSIALGMNASVVPHAPYSVHKKLFELIQVFHGERDGIWSIHHRESVSENEFIESGCGEFKKLFASLGLVSNDYKGEGVSSTEFVSQFFPANRKLLFVHNTYLTLEDLRFLKSTGRFDDMWFCICPKANLYIEKRLPNIPLMISEGCKMVLGTDSLASNNGLSIWDEIQTIVDAYPQIAVKELLKWATVNGSDLYGWSDFGSFEVGKSPGVVCVDGDTSKRIL
ncbi:MAG: amidohydrolase family protein [Bacteroidota bacterium]|jgi:cytosine/adenosine deaminase-related metal-dependent hydrolase